MELPDGFQRISGKRTPPSEGPWQIMLRCGHVDLRHTYETRQLVWIHGDHSGDIIAVRKA